MTAEARSAPADSIAAKIESSIHTMLDELADYGPGEKAKLTEAIANLQRARREGIEGGAANSGAAMERILAAEAERLERENRSYITETKPESTNG